MPHTTPIETGHVGMKLTSGQIVLTSTGGKTTPFPKVDMSTERKAANTLKRVNAWLIDNAEMEAIRRGDRFNVRQFHHTSRSQPTPAEKDLAELYLFDADFVVATPPQHLKSLTRNTTPYDLEHAA